MKVCFVSVVAIVFHLLLLLLDFDKAADLKLFML